MRGNLWHKGGSRSARTDDWGKVTGDDNEGFLLAIEIPSDPELLCVARSGVQQLAAVVELPEEECRWVTLAVDEAVANLIPDAYRSTRGWWSI